VTKEIPTAYYFKGFDSPSENIMNVIIGDYNNPAYEKTVRLTANYLAVTDREKLLDFASKHSLKFVLEKEFV
jgi:hypothetical protein